MKMMQDIKKWFKWIVAALVVGAVAIFVWQRYFVKHDDEGLASGNGRIEATDIDVAAKSRPDQRDTRARRRFRHSRTGGGAGGYGLLTVQRREAEAQLDGQQCGDPRGIRRPCGEKRKWKKIQIRSTPLIF